MNPKSDTGQIKPGVMRSQTASLERKKQWVRKIGEAREQQQARWNIEHGLPTYFDPCNPNSHPDWIELSERMLRIEQRERDQRDLERGVVIPQEPEYMAIIRCEGVGQEYEWKPGEGLVDARERERLIEQIKATREKTVTLGGVL